MLRVEKVTKVFERQIGSLMALSEVSLELQAGQFGTLIGPSGCGKTTLLRIVGGLIPASSGTVYVDGKRSMTPSQEKGFVFQQFNLFPWRTVLANAEYGLEMQGVPVSERRPKAREMLKMVGLAGFEQHYPSELSGGMRQRVGIARALLLKPKVLLMDEPFGALDAMTRELMQDELLNLIHEHGLTVLFVTHSVDEAVYVSDKIFVMGPRPGRIVRVFDVDFRSQASAREHIRALPEYGELRDRVWSVVRAELEAVR